MRKLHLWRHKPISDYNSWVTDAYENGIIQKRGNSYYIDDRELKSGDALIRDSDGYIIHTSTLSRGFKILYRWIAPLAYIVTFVLLLVEVGMRCSLGSTILASSYPVVWTALIIVYAQCTLRRFCRCLRNV